MSFLILTAAQAQALRGETSPGHALVPVPLSDGTFALPESILSDAAHAVHRAVLEDLPRVSEVSVMPVEEVTESPSQ